MTFSTAGLIGAAIGLLVALVAYVSVMGALGRSQPDPAQSAEQHAERARMASFMRVILLVDFPILGGLGFYAGQLLGQS